MKLKALMPAAVVAASFAAGSMYEAVGQDSLPPPGFHHLHLNSVNPDAAIAFKIIGGKSRKL